LQARGFTGVTEIAGGLAAWEAAGQPVQTSQIAP
jgi:rhodanese-related sulfurtransferase